jgi:hypothetical protein
MPDVIQVHAFLPRQLKRRAFSALAQQERKFSHWLRDALEEWLREVEQPRATQEYADVDQWKQKNGMAGSAKENHV